MRFRILLALTTLLPLLASAVHAKSVNLRWEPIEGAKSYELRFEKDGKVITRQCDSTQWEGDLGFGVYAYQIRAVDKLKRPGLWSDLVALAVMPDPPVPVFPADGAVLKTWARKPVARFSWKPVHGAAKYDFTLKHGQQLVLHSSTGSPWIEVPALDSGEYNWSVAAVLEPHRRAPASLLGRTWAGPSSGSQEFTVDRRELAAPKPLSPPSDEPIAPPADRRIELSWEKVEGAESYEVIFGKERNQVPIRTEKTATSIRLGSVTEGTWSWKVRALASVTKVDGRITGGDPGPEASSSFKVDRNAVLSQGGGYVALSTMLAPYSYQVISPSAGFRGSTDSTAITFRLSGEYWFRRNWGVGSGLDLTSFTMSNQQFNRKAFELTAKYQTNVTQDRYGWFIAPKAGLEIRDYLMITPAGGAIRGSALNSRKLTALGGQIGIDVRKQFSELWSLGIKFSCFIPVQMSGAQLAGNSVTRNWNLGAQGLRWLGRGWGVSAGAFIDKRSISYSGSAPGASEQITMDGSYFFGSLLYRW